MSSSLEAKRLDILQQAPTEDGAAIEAKWLEAWHGIVDTQAVLANELRLFVEIVDPTAARNGFFNSENALDMYFKYLTKLYAEHKAGGWQMNCFEREVYKRPNVWKQRPHFFLKYYSEWSVPFAQTNKHSQAHYLDPSNRELGNRLVRNMLERFSANPLRLEFQEFHEFHTTQRPSR